MVDELEKVRFGSFWESLGNPKYVVAPMVDQSELPFRLLCRRYSAHLTYTPMLHARIFSENEKYRKTYFQTSEDDRPLIAQFCGNDPQTLVKAASIIKDDVSAIDINCGCPQGIARKGKYGAYLLDFPNVITSIVHTVTAEVDINVTCKIRLVEKDDLQSTLNLCYALEASGCKALTVHGRDKTEKGVNISTCNWEAIRIIKSRLNIPVIANGGIETLDDVNRCLEYTGADAVMSSEAILEKPYLFTGREYNHLEIFKEYLSILKECPEQKLSSVKSHTFKMLHKYLQVHHEARDAIGRARSIESFYTIAEDLERVVSEDSAYSGSWYRRHRMPVNGITVSGPNPLVKGLTTS